MPERMKPPFKYIGNMGEYSLVPVSKELNPMQRLSSEALKENGFLKTLPLEKQEIALQTLSVLGNYTLSICQGRWNSYRWRDAWRELMKQAKPLINYAIAATGRPTIETGYENLFQMLDTGVETMEDLRRYIAAKKQDLPPETVNPNASVNAGIQYAHARRLTKR
jgi:hypothetical protein